MLDRDDQRTGHVWVFFHPCGCVAKLVSTDPAFATEAAKSIKDGIRRGMRPVMMSDEWLRTGAWTTLARCPHGQQQGELPLYLHGQEDPY